jgi:phosphate transport system protein
MEKMSFSQHISHQFNANLEEIRNRVLAMGGMVEQQLASAVTALVEGDPEVGRRVMTSDHMINAAEVELDEECVHILARRQPTASDLRLIIAVIKTITDLERIGDEAERIGRMAVHLVELGQYKSLMADMESLANNVRQTLHGALDAFARMDAEQAVAVAQQDVDSDRQYEVIMRQLMEHMMQDAASVPRVMDVIWAARSLERIGDRSRNICEYVVYLVKGKDVRHTSFEQMAERAGYKPQGG